MCIMLGVLASKSWIKVRLSVEADNIDWGNRELAPTGHVDIIG
jgi:hypothetical protein